MAYLLKDFSEERNRRRREQQQQQQQQDDDERADSNSSGKGPSLIRSVFTALHGTTPSQHQQQQQQGTAASPHAPNKQRPHGISDEELYRTAVDYRDIMAVISAPTVPPTRGGFSGDSPSSSSSSAASDSASASVLPGAVAGGGGIGAPPTSSSTHASSFPSSYSSPSSISKQPTGQQQQSQQSQSQHQNGTEFLLAGPNANDGGALAFRRIANDPSTGVEVFSAPVKDFPIHLMRATAVMPCTPTELLQYMDNDIRPKWDAYIRESRVIRPLARPEAQVGLTSSSSSSQSEQPLPSSSSSYSFSSFSDAVSRGGGGGGSGGGVPLGLSGSINVRGAGAPRSDTSLAAESVRTANIAHRLTSGTDGSSNSGGGVRTETQPPFAFLPGQCRVAVHYLGCKSPVMFVQDRDFELVVSEAVLADGTAVMKAFSAPHGSGMPLDPAQHRYVRAVVVRSGFVGRPLRLPIGGPHRRKEAEAVIARLPVSLREVAVQRLKEAAAAAAAAAAASGGGGSSPSSSSSFIVPITTTSNSNINRNSTDTTPNTTTTAAATDDGEVVFCQLEYFGLVHPLGLIPPQIANVVIFAQLEAMRRLQAFVTAHPLASLRPTPLPVPDWQRRREQNRRLSAAASNRNSNGSGGGGCGGGGGDAAATPLSQQQQQPRESKGKKARPTGAGSDAPWWKPRILSRL